MARHVVSMALPNASKYPAQQLIIIFNFMLLLSIMTTKKQFKADLCVAFHSGLVTAASFEAVTHHIL